MVMTAKGLTKLNEECGELVQIIGKKLAYFHTDEHPDGKGSLKERLEDEIADVCAAIRFAADVNGLDRKRINARIAKKYRLFHEWHQTPENNVHGVDQPAQREGSDLSGQCWPCGHAKLHPDDELCRECNDGWTP